jgi:HlyD family secretion protein
MPCSPELDALDRPARIGACLLSLLALSACKPDPAVPFSGYAEADLIYLAPSGGGVLQDLKVQRGEHVSKGQALFQVDSASESYSRDAAVAQQDRAKAQLADLGKGRRKEEIKAIQAQRAQARAALDVSTSQLKRQRDLVRQGYVSAARLDELEAAQARDAARLSEVQAQLALARDAARPDTIQAARAELQAAGAQVSQSAWAASQKGRSAPLAATVFDVLYRPGEWVAPGAPVVALLPDQGVKLRFFVPQASLAQIKVGGAVHYACDSCAGGQARVRYVSPQAEFTPPIIYSNESKGKLVYLIEATPEGAQATELKPGQPLTVSLPS